MRDLCTLFFKILSATDRQYTSVLIMIYCVQEGGLGMLDALVAVSFPTRGGPPPRTSTEHAGNGQTAFSSSFGAATGSDGASAGCQLADVPEFIRVGLTIATRPPAP